ncbi:chemotaxis protein CheA [Vibrio porteresiae]|uniref:Chemotaxis protein CheA n=1 Tax=Vibrio porteresiae DSM 19223 TaxID=1123496 RepID=A0ABZ0QF68_9VIBR|nr:chemotaxis protein CheA [Vibrio porteresiae]WPC75049.1 chemotaxis protein CheA [Vibrio porteresiae DSM 19223]
MIGPIETFQTEAREHLEALESALLDLEEDGDNFELINRAFRAMHTIKGGAGMFGFIQLTEFTHHVENLLDKIRTGELKINSDIIGLLLDIGDFTGTLLDDPNFTDEQHAKAEQFIDRITALSHVDSPAVISEETVQDTAEIAPEIATEVVAENTPLPKLKLMVFRVNFAPDINSFRAGLDVFPILNELHQCGELFVTTVDEPIPHIADYDPESAYLRFECVLVTLKNRQFIDDIFMFVCDDWAITIEPIDIEGFNAKEGSLRDFLHAQGHISAQQANIIERDVSPASLIESSETEPSEIEPSEIASSDIQESATEPSDAASFEADVADAESLETEVLEAAAQEISEIPIEPKTSSSPVLELPDAKVPASVTPNLVKRSETESTAKKPESSASHDASKATIRVAAEKLDSLMNLVGELVIVQARLNQFATQSENEEVLAIAEELDLLTNQMRDETFGIRLVPIGTTFGRFRRLVRDLSVDLHKQITLETEGEETELDKMVIDKLSDPLIHIIRNSIDHGIESPEERLAANKPANGTIRLKAEHAESHVLITITDDGKGLNGSKIREKALDKGLINANDDLSEEQLHQLIFEPGFSTAAVISDISGRGVGMDVVRRSIQELGGKVLLKSTQGKGTQIKISLPMTLAIIEGLLVQVGEEHFVLPLNSVEECIELPVNVASGKKRIIEVRGQQIPYIALREHFSVQGEKPRIEQVVVLHNEEERFGFCVDEVVGQYQTVIKRLGRFYEGIVGFSGATIMGDGNVAIVLDPQSIIESTAM